jgi:hypothetical protein
MQDHEGRIAFVSGKGWFKAEDFLDNCTVFILQKDVERERFLKLDDRIVFTLVPDRKDPTRLQGIDVKYVGHIVARQTGSKEVQS